VKKIIPTVLVGLMLCSCASAKQGQQNYANTILTVSVAGMVMEPPGAENGPIDEFNKGFISNLYDFYNSHFSLNGGYIRTWTSSNPVSQIAIEDFVFGTQQDAQNAFLSTENAIKNVSGNFKVQKTLNIGLKLNIISLFLEGQAGRETIYALQSSFVCKNAIYFIQMQSIDNVFDAHALRQLVLKQYSLGFNTLKPNLTPNYFAFLIVIGFVLIIAGLALVVWWWGPPRRRNLKRSNEPNENKFNFLGRYKL
jgi:hypothetical protein